MFKCNDCDFETENLKLAMNHAYGNLGDQQQSHTLERTVDDEGTTMTVSVVYDDDNDDDLYDDEF